MDAAHVTRYELDDAIVLCPVGEFDIASVEVLRSSFLDALGAGHQLVVDLSGTTFLDSIALGALVSAGRQARTNGGWLRLVNPPENVRRALAVTEIDKVFGLYDTTEQAVAHRDDGDAGASS
jgi:anti-sigma B factor antagonist